MCYKFRNEYKEIYIQLKKYLDQKFNSELYSIVFEVQEKISDIEIMNKTFMEMDKSDIIIAEVSYKSIGIGLEVGYFKALKKKILYLHKVDTEVEQTINGVSDFVIDYSNIQDITSWFDNNFNKLT